MINFGRTNSPQPAQSADEQAHAEAFAQLTPEQRRQVLQAMRDEVPPAERAMAEQGGATPEALARMATRAEIRQPGSLGGMMAGGLLSGIAGAVIGSMIARQFFSDPGAANAGNAADAGQDTEAGDADQTMGDAGDGMDLGSFDV